MMLQIGGDRRRSLVAAILAVGLVSHSVSLAALPSGNTATPEKHALLIGCTNYPDAANIPELWGPANDVPAVASLLTERFEFPEQNIHRLVGWTDDTTSRPTYGNIVAGFEHLIEVASPNSQIVVLMTGHGTQSPVPESQLNAADPSNPEHDGMDEVFLPADFGGWTESGLKNAILDNQIGDWLSQLEECGAAVWIIFDCCHSGTMTRDADMVERHRGVKPQIAGIPDSALRAAAGKVSQSPERSRSTLVPVADTLDLPTPKSAGGSVTAFYAAQAFETAPELPRPSDAPRTPENYFGLLTSVLIQTLETHNDSMTYRDLGRRIINRYRAERGSKSPTPFFSGELDREVLGLSVFPERSSIILQRDGDSATVSAGAFLGITPGTILAVYPPTDRTRDDAAVLGHVIVTNVTASSSSVESCEYNDVMTVPISEFPELARCAIVMQDLGDMRLKLAVQDLSSADGNVDVTAIAAAIDALPVEIGSLVKRVDDPKLADWLLMGVQPDEAETRYGIHLHRPTVLLVRNGVATDLTGKTTQSVTMRNVFGQYPLTSADLMARRMQIDLQKLFSWQNTWRIAGLASGEQSRSGSKTLKLEVSRVGDDGNPIEQGQSTQSSFFPGDDLRVRIVNDGTDDLWVTLLYLDSNFGIGVWFSEALKAGKSFTDGGTVDGSSSGPEGFIVLAAPVRSQKSQPLYDFLEQEGVGVATRAVNRPPTRPLNPFEQLMSAAAFGKGRHRGLRRKASSTPQILSWSWVTLPVAESD